MGQIFTFLELRNGAVARSSLEALRGGQELAAQLHHTHTAVLFGLEAPPRELTGLQLDDILVAPAPQLAIYTSDQYVAAMDAVINAEAPNMLLAAHTYQAHDWLPRLACRLGRPLVSDCVGFRLDGDLVWLRPLFQGKMNAEVKTTPGLVMVSFQAGTFRSDDLESGSPSVRTHDLDLLAVPVRVQPGKAVQEGRGAVDLSRAERIVSVGRGIGSEENLPLVQALAEALDAELGASRPVVDYGWLPHAHQVGSSGQTVAPKLYLAVGISGAIQHQVGMKGSGCVVAINKDPHAPIFEIADYGIVADFMEIVPPLTAALLERRSG